MLKNVRLLSRAPVRYIKSFEERRQEAQMKKQQESFKKTMEELSRKEHYTLKDFKLEILQQAKQASTGIKKLWSGTQPEEAELLRMKKVMNALKEQELNESREVSDRVRQEVAQVVQLPIEEVNKVMKAYKFNRTLQGYLKQRREHNEYLPQTQEELTQILYTDRPPKSREQDFRRQKKYSRKMLKLMAYRKY